MAISIKRLPAANPSRSIAEKPSHRPPSNDASQDLSAAAAQVRYDALAGRTNLLLKLPARAQRDAGATLDNGQATLSVEPRTGGTPLLRAQLALSDATMPRIGAAQASIEQVAFEADVLASRPVDGERETARVALKIPSARVTDMSVFRS